MKLDQNKYILVQVMLAYTCNMDCNYCYQDFSKNIGLKMMTVNTFQNILNLFQGKEIDLNLYGGEPLLNQEIINFMISDGFVLPSSIKIISVNTNGILINEVFYRFYEKFKDKIIIDLSLDGNKEIHDMNRKLHGQEPTYERILSNLKYFSDFNSFSINFCVSPSSINQLYNAVENLVNLGFRKIKMMFLYEKKWEQRHFRKLISEFIRLKKYKGIIDINIFNMGYINNQECRDEFMKNFTFLPSGEVIPCPVWFSKYSNQVKNISSIRVKSLEDKYNYIEKNIFGDRGLFNIINKGAICESVQGFVFKKNKSFVENILKRVYN